MFSYLLINLLTLAGPMARSFEPRIAYWRKWKALFPAIGLTMVLFITWDATRTIWYRLMDAIDPKMVDQVEEVARSVEGVVGVQETRIRWLGHRLHTELGITVNEDLPIRES